MSRPAFEVADLIRAQGTSFELRYRSWLSFQQLRVLQAIRCCRTSALGGHIDACPRCDERAISYNSCRNRHCPKCQAQARQRWLSAREQEVLDVPYFHVVFTLPHALKRLCERNPKVLYNLLFRVSAQTLLEVAANPKRLGAKIGFLSILHTWGQNLTLHPHIHCVIPGGGLSLDGNHWVRPKRAFFLPVKVLSKVFRGKFVDGLHKAFKRGELELSGSLKSLRDPKNFAAFLRILFRNNWVVYAKPAFGGPAQVLRYLGRYTHRVAISNHRLVAFDGERVTFRWRDYANGNRQRTMTLSATEFLRRFVQHVLPRGFVRIRQFGLLANRCRKPMLALARKLLASTPQAILSSQSDPAPLWRCPRCSAPMRIGRQLTAAELALQGGYFDTS